MKNEKIDLSLRYIVELRRKTIFNITVRILSVERHVGALGGIETKDKE